MNTAIKGHLLAIFTVICWGTTFISTKILLADFSPIEILVTRFVIGLTILYIIRPHVLKLRHEEHRLYLFIAALSGITLYYLMENIALTYTYASNVGIITSTAPFFAAILARFTIKNSHLSGPFFVGFILSMIGVFLISVEDGGFNFNLKGDLLALGAAVLWAVYAVVLKKICTFGYDLITVTREIFLYGIVFNDLFDHKPQNQQTDSQADHLDQILLPAFIFSQPLFLFFFLLLYTVIIHFAHMILHILQKLAVCRDHVGKKTDHDGLKAQKEQRAA